MRGHRKIHMEWQTHTPLSCPFMRYKSQGGLQQNLSQFIPPTVETLQDFFIPWGECLFWKKIVMHNKSFHYFWEKQCFLSHFKSSLLLLTLKMLETDKGILLVLLFEVHVSALGINEYIRDKDRFHLEIFTLQLPSPPTHILWTHE